MKPASRDRFCSHCGTEFLDTSRYPRAGPNAGCALQTWSNPIPVVVALVPVVDATRLGVMVIRRSVPPQSGKLALVGGFLESHESWQQGMTREVREETGVGIDPATLVPLGYASTEPRPDRVLLFAESETLDAARLPAFTRSTESTERGLVYGPQGLGDVFAFPLHTRALERFFAERGVQGHHAYRAV